MSTKRILGITIFAILSIIVLIGLMLLIPYLGRDNDPLPLPEASAPTESPGAAEPDTLDRVEVTQDTIQPVVATMSRPATYSRDVLITSFWDGGQAEYNFSVSVSDAMTSIRTVTPAGVEKRIIVTSDMLYIWYRGDRTPYSCAIGASPIGAGSAVTFGDGVRTADELQMLVTYEDVLKLEKNDIIDAGYTEFGDEECVYAAYRAPGLGYIMKYYISLELGLIVGAEERDETGAIVYRMSAGECLFEADAAAFTLPDGTALTPSLISRTAQ